MFESLKRKIRAAENLTDRNVSILMFSDPKTQELIIFLNTEDQLFKRRIDAAGDLLPEYSEATEIITQGRKKAGENYNLKDSGAFYESFNVSVDARGDAIINAVTIKKSTDFGRVIVSNLLETASPDIIGLINENKATLSRFLVTVIQAIVRKILVSS